MFRHVTPRLPITEVHCLWEIQRIDCRIDISVSRIKYSGVFVRELAEDSARCQMTRLKDHSSPVVPYCTLE